MSLACRLSIRHHTVYLEGGSPFHSAALSSTFGARFTFVSLTIRSNDSDSSRVLLVNISIGVGRCYSCYCLARWATRSRSTAEYDSSRISDILHVFAVCDN